MSMIIALFAVNAGLIGTYLVYDVWTDRRYEKRLSCYEKETKKAT